MVLTDIVVDSSGGGTPVCRDICGNQLKRNMNLFVKIKILLTGFNLFPDCQIVSGICLISKKSVISCLISKKSVISCLISKKAVISCLLSKKAVIFCLLSKSDQHTFFQLFGRPPLQKKSLKSKNSLKSDYSLKRKYLAA